MLEPLPEQELREHMLQAKLHPETDARDAKIHRAASRIIDGGLVFYVLVDTPGQCEDYFSILVNDDAVIDFELERNNPAASPTEAERYSVDDWRGTVGEITQAKLRITLELARKDLGR
jgi:hypothetical protein